jgi:hypothetical protein
MKQTILTLGTILGLFSCSKYQAPPSTGNPGEQSSNSQVASLAMYSPSSKNLTKYSFVYDAKGNLTQLGYSSYDTTGGVAALDTGSYYFTIDPSTNLASSYTLVWNNANTGTFSQTHALFFDDQKRLIKDTLISGQAGSGNNAAFHFFYPASGIVSYGYTMNAYDSVSKADGWGVSGIDSITLINGNIGTQYEYAQNGNSWIIGYSYVVQNYSPNANPLHGLDRSSGLGALLRNYNSLDCISKSLPADGMTNWTTDANGRVVGGLGTDGSITTYTYK